MNTHQMRVVYTAVLMILLSCSANGETETRIDKIGSNTLMNNYVGASGTNSAIANLIDSKYLAVWRDFTSSNLTLEIRSIDISNISSYNASREEIVRYESSLTLDIGYLKLTKLRSGVGLLTWLHGTSPSYARLVGCFIQHNDSTSEIKFQHNEFVIHNSTYSSGIYSYDVEVTNNGVFYVSISTSIGSSKYITLRSFNFDLMGNGNMLATEIGKPINISDVESSKIGQAIGNRFLVTYKVPFDKIFGQIYCIIGNQTVNTTQPFLINNIVRNYMNLYNIIRVGSIWVVSWQWQYLTGSIVRNFYSGININGTRELDDFESPDIGAYVTSMTAIGENRFVAVHDKNNQYDGIYYQVIERNASQFSQIGSITRIDDLAQDTTIYTRISGDMKGFFGVVWCGNYPYKVYTQFYHVHDVVSTTQSITTGPTAGLTGAGTSSTATPKVGTVIDSSSNSVVLGIISIVITIVFCLIWVLSIGFYLLKKRRKSDSDDIDENRHSSISTDQISVEGATCATTPSGDLRTDGTRTKIKDQFILIDKITRDEALDLEEQVGIHISFPPDVIKISYLIGEGNGGKVRPSKDEHTNKYVGVKKIKGKKKIHLFDDECQIQMKLDHPNILPLIDSVRTTDAQGRDALYIFMPLLIMDGTTFSELIQRLTFPEKEMFILYTFRCVVEGVAYMHQHGYYHRDLKLSNILIGKDGEVKVIDFGVTCYSETGMIDKAAGDIATFAPESCELVRRGRSPLSGDRPTNSAPSNFVERDQTKPDSHILSVNASKVDVWAIGLAMMEAFVGTYPLDKMSFDQMLGRTIQHFTDKLTVSMTHLDDQSPVSKIIKVSLIINPDDRPDIRGVSDMFMEIPQTDMTGRFAQLTLMYKAKMTESSGTGQIYMSSGNKYGGVADDYMSTGSEYGGVADDYMSPDPINKDVLITVSSTDMLDSTSSETIQPLPIADDMYNTST